MLGILDEVAIPGRPADDTIRFRHYRGPDDLPGMAAGNEAMRDADWTKPFPDDHGKDPRA